MIFFKLSIAGGYWIRTLAVLDPMLLRGAPITHIDAYNSFRSRLCVMSRLMFADPELKFFLSSLSFILILTGAPIDGKYGNSHYRWDIAR